MTLNARKPTALH